MPSKKVPAPQARAQLKKLKSLGLFTGDLRKKPTARTLKLIREFDAVLKGKAAVVQPANPKQYKGAFKVVGKSVVVPKRKGERVKVSKSGEIVSTGKTRTGRTVTRTVKTVKKGGTGGIAKPADGELVQYAIPFNFRSGREWKRFPNWDELQKYMSGSNSVANWKNWPDYVAVEKLSNPLTDEQLERQVKRRNTDWKPKTKKRRSRKRKSVGKRG